ncbi:MAG: hypothetical protein HY960_11135 [Ignavibacteriae bacterium]|nr:hypothetical protein [Ignavibacteriota bacterium]
MQASKISDIRYLYANYIDNDLTDNIILFLDITDKHYSNRIEIKTRSEKSGEPLGYFSLFMSPTDNTVRFAGGIENKLPVIRFTFSNPFLKYVPNQLKIPYRKNKPTNSDDQNWMYVIISKESILMFLSLMVMQLELDIK